MLCNKYNLVFFSVSQPLDQLAVLAGHVLMDKKELHNRSR